MKVSVTKGHVLLELIEEAGEIKRPSGIIMTQNTAKPVYLKVIKINGEADFTVGQFIELSRDASIKRLPPEFGNYAVCKITDVMAYWSRE